MTITGRGCYMLMFHAMPPISLYGIIYVTWLVYQPGTRTYHSLITVAFSIPVM